MCGYSHSIQGDIQVLFSGIFRLIQWDIHTYSGDIQAYSGGIQRMGKAVCTECGNEWETRKPVEKIDQPRCSECGATGERIELGGREAGEKGGEAVSVVDRVRLKERKQDLVDRAEKGCERIEEVGGGSVPGELEPVYRRLSSLSEELADQKGVSQNELNRAEEFIDSQLEEIEATEGVEEVGDLEKRIEELKKEEDELISEIITKQREYDRLKGEYSDLVGLWGRVENNAKWYRKGLKDGFETAQENPTLSFVEVCEQIEFPESME